MCRCRHCVVADLCATICAQVQEGVYRPIAINDEDDEDDNDNDDDDDDDNDDSDDANGKKKKKKKDEEEDSDSDDTVNNDDDYGDNTLHSTATSLRAPTKSSAAALDAVKDTTSGNGHHEGSSTHNSELETDPIPARVPTKRELFERSMMQTATRSSGAVPAQPLLGVLAGPKPPDSVAKGSSRVAMQPPAPPTAADVIELGMNVHSCEGDEALDGARDSRHRGARVADDTVARVAAAATAHSTSVDPEVVLWLSAQYMMRREYLSSLEILEVALGNMLSDGIDSPNKDALGPALFRCYFNSAASLAGNGQFKESIEEWTDLIDFVLDTELVQRTGLAVDEQRELLYEALANRAWCLTRCGRPHDAIDSFDSQYLDLLDNGVKELTGPHRGSAGDGMPVALCLHVLARAYLALGKHELAYQMFEGAADVVRDDKLVWPLAHVWACVAVHAAVTNHSDGFGSASAMPEWINRALDAVVRRSAEAADELEQLETPRVEWVRVVCHQAAFSCWVLGRNEEIEAWIIRSQRG